MKFLAFLLFAWAKGLRRSFERELTFPAYYQNKLLKRIIKEASHGEYGRHFKLSRHSDYAEYKKRIPIVGYEDLEPWILKQKDLGKNSFGREKVLFYEKTSGSSGATKYIPYTRALKSSFQSMFLLWLGDLSKNGPKLHHFRTYMSVSPALAATETAESGTPVGIEDDTEYLNFFAKVLVKRFLFVPKSVKSVRDPETFLRVLACYLVAQADLEIISIWSPTFLVQVLEFIKTNPEKIISTLRAGELKTSKGNFKFSPVHEVRLQLLNEKKIDWRKLWPDLKLISAWASAQSEFFANRLRGELPQVFFQAKGLLATEAPMTLPWISARGCVPLPAEIFYEFEDGEGQIRLLHELALGQDYGLILTQKSGLLRYRIGDRVRVSATYLNTPCLEFIGRSESVSDLVGEKLNEDYVAECFREIAGDQYFALLIPEFDADGAARYIAVFEEPAQIHRPEILALALDRRLQRAYHYQQARQLGQLEQIQVLLHHSPQTVYNDYYLRQGMKWGDIKSKTLIHNVNTGREIIALFRAEPQSPRTPAP